MEGREEFLPLKGIMFNGVIDCGIASVKMNLEYENATQNPVECSFEFPQSTNTIVTGL